MYEAEQSAHCTTARALIVQPHTLANLAEILKPGNKNMKTPLNNQTNLYMHNTTGDVTLTNIRRETKY